MIGARVGIRHSGSAKAMLALLVGAGVVACTPLILSIGAIPRFWGRGWMVTVSDATLRTIIVSTVAAIVSVVLGFWLALCMRAVSPRTLLGRCCSLFMLPALAGATTIAFLLKATLLANPQFMEWFADRPSLGTVTFYVCVYAWQYSPLACYLFWLRGHSLPPSIRAFERSASLTLGEFARDVAWPAAHSLAIVLSVFIVLSVSQDYAIGHYVFRASTGSGTALSTHALMERYDVLLAAAPSTATQVILANSAILVPVFLLASVLGVLCTVVVQRLLLTFACRLSHRSSGPRAPSSRAASIAVLLLVVLPLSVPIVFFPPALGRSPIPLAGALTISLVGSLAAAALALLLGMALRVTFLRGLQSLSRRSFRIVLVIVLLKAIPILGVAQLCFYWLWPMLAHGTPAIFVAWIAAHALIHLPFLALFVLWIHHRVKSIELEYQSLAEASGRELILHSFISAFRRDYMLVLLFAWSFVWNESIINRIVSDRMPSLSASLAPLIGTRPDYRTAMTFVLISLVIFCVAIPMWSSIAARAIPGEGSP